MPEAQKERAAGLLNLAGRLDDRLARVRHVVAMVIVGASGFSQFGLFFSDLEPGGTIELRIIVGAGLVLLTGLALGFLAPRIWPLYCVLSAWGTLVAGLMMGFMAELRIGLLLAFGGVSVALVGGALGMLVRKLTKKTC